jgi:methyl-accepting chemotaxis protein
MSWLLNVPISRKFAFAFSIVCGLCVLLGIYTFCALRSITTMNQKVSAKSFPSVVHLTDARAAINSVRREDLDLLLCRAAACKELHTARRQ